MKKSAYLLLFLVFILIFLSSVIKATTCMQACYGNGTSQRYCPDVCDGDLSYCDCEPIDETVPAICGPASGHCTYQNSTTNQWINFNPSIFCRNPRQCPSTLPYCRYYNESHCYNASTVNGARPKYCIYYSTYYNRWNYVSPLRTCTSNAQCSSGTICEMGTDCAPDNLPQSCPGNFLCYQGACRLINTTGLLRIAFTKNWFVKGEPIQLSGLYPPGSQPITTEAIFETEKSQEDTNKINDQEIDKNLIDSSEGSSQTSSQEPESYGVIAQLKGIPVEVFQKKLEKKELSEDEIQDELENYDEVAGTKTPVNIIKTTGKSVFNDLRRIFGNKEQETEQEQEINVQNQGVKLSLSKNEYSSLLNKQDKSTEEIKQLVDVHKEIVKTKHDAIKQMFQEEVFGETEKVYNSVFLNIDIEQCEKLKDVGLVKRCFLNEPMKPSLDTSVNEENIKATIAWTEKDFCDQNIKGDGIVIGIMDTGVDTTHPDLDQGKVVEEHCYCFQWGGCCIQPGTQPGTQTSQNEAHGTNTAIDREGHGTHIAGILAGTGEASILAGSEPPIEGVAQKSKIVAIRIGDERGRAYAANLIYAFENIGEDISFPNFPSVISLSFGSEGVYDNQGDCDEQPMSEALNGFVFVEDIPVVAATGNDYEFGISAPACASRAIAVGSASDYHSSYQEQFTECYHISNSVVGSCEVYPNEIDCVSVPMWCIWMPGNLINPAKCENIYNVGDPEEFETKASYFCQSASIYRIRDPMTYLVFEANCENGWMLGCHIRQVNRWVLPSSNKGSPPYYDRIDVVAPGSNICSAKSSVPIPSIGTTGEPCEGYGPEYFELSGTSFAAPHVAGIAALMKQIYPYLTALNIKAILRRSAQAIPNYPSLFAGWGYVDTEDTVRDTLWFANQRSYECASTQNSPGGYLLTCGNGECVPEAGENYSTCCRDCPQCPPINGQQYHCGFNQNDPNDRGTCVIGAPARQGECGNGNIEPWENATNCCWDVDKDCSESGSNKRCANNYRIWHNSSGWDNIWRCLNKNPAQIFLNENSISNKIEGYEIFDGTVRDGGNGPGVYEYPGHTMYREEWINYVKFDIKDRGVWRNIGYRLLSVGHSLIENERIWLVDSRTIPDGIYNSSQINLTLKQDYYQNYAYISTTILAQNTSNAALNIDNDYLTIVYPEYPIAGDNLEVYGVVRKPVSGNINSVIIEYGRAGASCYGNSSNIVTEWTTLGINSSFNGTEISMDKIADIDTSYMDNPGCYFIRMGVTKTPSGASAFTNIDYTKVQVSAPAGLSWPTKRVSGSVVSKTKVGYRVNLQGTVRVQRLQEYQIFWKKQGTNQWRSDGINLRNGGTQRVSGILGIWDLTNFEQGEYDVKLKVRYLSVSGQEIIVEDTGTLTVEFVPSIINNTGNNTITGYLVCNLKKHSDYSGQWINLGNIIQDSSTEQRVITGHNRLALANVINTKLQQTNTDNLDVGTYMLTCYLATRPNGGYDDAVGVRDEYGRLRYLRDFDFFTIEQDTSSGSSTVTAAIKDIPARTSGFFEKIVLFFKRVF
jgi:subtilisin family serine protease